MAEPTVQVPVSLIKRAVEGLLKAPGRDAILVCGELHALLSQPTPSAEPPCDDCGHDMADHTTTQGCTFAWHIATGCMCGSVPTAAPPRIEDMAPGTTFTATVPSEIWRWALRSDGLAVSAAGV